jgi:hypothetical protein
VPDEPLVLGIGTACEETGVGIGGGHPLLADALASSVDRFARLDLPADSAMPLTAVTVAG